MGGKKVTFAIAQKGNKWHGVKYDGPSSRTSSLTEQQPVVMWKTILQLSSYCVARLIEICVHMSCSGGCSSGLGWRSTLPALQGTGVDHQQHGVQWGRGPPDHRDTVRESWHHSGHLAHSMAALPAIKEALSTQGVLLFLIFLSRLYPRPLRRETS